MRQAVKVVTHSNVIYPTLFRLLRNAAGVIFFPCGLLNGELANGPIGQASIPTRKRVVWAGQLKNRSIGCSTGFVEGQAGTVVFHLEPADEIGRVASGPG
jgi:hypothetical protein